ncbi:MAG: penicillin acylase family protein [Pseudomonadota bacterium]
MKRLLLSVLLVLLIACLASLQWLTHVNDYRVSGELSLAVLTEPVIVTRDERGVAHIAAANRRDMLRAQGFITAQDRLFQMEFFRMIAWGRLSELVGDAGVASDTEMRVLGLAHNARRMAGQFAPDVAQFLGDYLAGVNAYIATQKEEYPVELSLLGHTPEPWTLEDSAIVLQYISLQHSVNMRAEAISLALVDAVGAARASTLMPINANPDRQEQKLVAKFVDPGPPIVDYSAGLSTTTTEALTQRTHQEGAIFSTGIHRRLAPAHFGSNNWVVGPARSKSGSAVVVNDPHLDARLLPGVWYPIGLSTPDFHAAGVALPAIPGIVVGRTDRVAFGVTNAYGDVQDLFIETVDPNSDDHYLESGVSVPFDLRSETLRVKDDDVPGGFREEKLTVRSTRRGPVVSDHGIVNIPNRVLSLRWGAAIAFGPEIGYDKMFFARSATEVDRAAQLMDINMFNIVFADVDGNFGRRATGKIPNRRIGQGVVPVTVQDAGPYWTSWIPKDQLPGEFNPERGWSGTANHDTRPDDYPFTYSTFFSPSYRYRRLIELMEGQERTSVSDHWAFMQDVKNLQAQRMASYLLPVLRDLGYEEIAVALETWDYRDSIDEHAPLLYQTLYGELAVATFEDELGEKLSRELLGNWYYWQERFDEMVFSGESIWFDDTTTDDAETLRDMVQRAAHSAQVRLAEFGATPLWGDVHRISFTSPMRQSGFGSGWLGGGDHPISGSGETLRRARYPFNEPYETAFFASFNFVSDMSATEDMITALPGGVAARVLHPHYADQLPAWLQAVPTPTPLSRAAAQGAAVTTLRLTPAG